MSKKTIWTIVLLVGGYLICQMIADVSATKIIEVAGIALPAGSIIFAATFTLRDMLHKRLGREWARIAIIAAALFNIVMAGYLAIMALFPSPVWFELADAWNAIFALVPSITIASITAEVVSEWVDTEIYHFYKNRFKTHPQWMRVVASNFVSIPLDSIIFAFLAFVFLPRIFGGEPIPFAAAWAIVGGQIIFKAIVTVVSMPGIYLVKDKPIEGLENV